MKLIDKYLLSIILITWNANAADTVLIHTLHPTQIGVGVDVVKYGIYPNEFAGVIENALLASGADSSLITKLKEISKISDPAEKLAQYQSFLRTQVVSNPVLGEKFYENIQSAVNQVFTKEIPVYIGPNLKPYMVDGHHRGLSQLLINDEIKNLYPEKTFALKVNYKIIEDFSKLGYSKENQKAFARFLLTNDEVTLGGKKMRGVKKGYMSKAMRQTLAKNPENAHLLLAQFPQTLDRLSQPSKLGTFFGDSRLRSLMGVGFFNGGVAALNSDVMVDYNEFLVGEYLETHYSAEVKKILDAYPGSKIVSDEAASEALRKLLRKPDVFKLLYESARSQSVGGLLAFNRNMHEFASNEKILDQLTSLINPTEANHLKRILQFEDSIVCSGTR